MGGEAVYRFTLYVNDQTPPGVVAAIEALAAHSTEAIRAERGSYDQDTRFVRRADLVNFLIPRHPELTPIGIRGLIGRCWSVITLWGRDHPDLNYLVVCVLCDRIQSECGCAAHEDNWKVGLDSISRNMPALASMSVRQFGARHRAYLREAIDHM